MLAEEVALIRLVKEGIFLSAVSLQSAMLHVVPHCVA